MAAIPHYRQNFAELDQRTGSAHASSFHQDLRHTSPIAKSLSRPANCHLDLLCVAGVILFFGNKATGKVNRRQHVSNVRFRFAKTKSHSHTLEYPEQVHIHLKHLHMANHLKLFSASQHCCREVWREDMQQSIEYHPKEARVSQGDMADHSHTRNHSIRRRCPAVLNYY